MKVFVTGATGFVGHAVVRLLNERGHSISFLTAHPNSGAVARFKADYSAQPIVGDILEPGRLHEALEGCDSVIHLVGIISEIGRKTFENVHTEGSKSVIAAAQRAKVSRFVHMSALGTRPDARSRYHKSKWVAEEVLRASGLDFTIFRPSLIYGPEDHFVNLFAKIIRWSPVVPVLGRPDATFQPIQVEQVARSFLGALDQPAAVGKTYDLCGSETLTMSEMLDRILLALRKQRFKLKIPPFLARAQATMLEKVFPALLRRAPPLNRDQLLMLNEDNVGDGAPARELFGLERVSFSEGIARYLGK